MIVFDLDCENGHRFEGWFGSSSDFADQQARGLLACPSCGTQEVIKAPMAPAIGTSGDGEAREEMRSKAQLEPVPTQVKPTGENVTNHAIPPKLVEAFTKIAKAQAEMLKKSAWVGDKFADEARSMHYGEKDEKPIHGKTSPKQARELLEEGIAVAPLLVPVAPPDELN